MKKIIFISILLSFCYYLFGQPKSKQILEKLEGFDLYMDTILTDWNAPGIGIGIVFKNELVFAKGYGFRDYEQKLPITANTLFQIASNTKLFAEPSNFTLLPVDSLHAWPAESPERGFIVPADTQQTSLWPALIRSAIIPGWGQIEQEYPGKAVIFYGLGLTCLYNIAYNYQWYQKTNAYVNKLKMRHFTIAYLQIYVINLVDIIETHRSGSDKSWPQNLYSDTPLKSPWGAVARSAMLPGWGQCYNESYIKSVLGFGAFFYFASRIYDYEKKYRDTRNVEYKDKRVTNSWYLGLTYVIIMIDAYVDAYLYRFDDTIKLTYQYVPDEKVFTFGVKIVF